MKHFTQETNHMVDQKLLRDLFMHTNSSLTTLLVLSVLFFMFLLGKVPGSLLYPWFFLVFTINLSRLYDTYVYLHKEHQKTYQKWYKIFTYKSYVTALLWGSSSLLFLPHIGDLELRNVVFIFIVGIGSGAMSSISPDTRAAATYLFLLTMPLFAYLIFQGGSTNYVLAFMLFAYFFLLIRVSRNTCDTLITNYKQEEAYKATQNELSYLARHDDLTSLANRRGFVEYMQNLVEEKHHQDHFSIFFYLDLNQFKTINDTMGHNVGDQLLILVANRLRLLITEDYFLSRQGGDEFSIVLPFVATSKKEAQKKAYRFSVKLQKAFVSAFLIEGLHLYIKGSIGIVIIEPKMEDIEEIIRYADIAMYNAKRKGRNAVAYYNATLDIERKKLFRLRHDLYRAIENHEFRLYYQPIVTIKDDRLRAAETLVRWYHPKLGVLLPETFIPLAIESGLIDEIGWLVIDLVCKQIMKWKSQSLFLSEYISVNVNAIQLQGSNFEEKFWGILKKYGVKAHEIRLEITENSLIDNFEQTKEIIERLRVEGIRCAIDDFGMGYSSLSYL
ncbi:MAG TPA: EAL domain-containing protein, partial [Epsilonproteobacteria bacterium]|nr:EAL domain-containing protein [Campylobacterota bacterium]